MASQGLQSNNTRLAILCRDVLNNCQQSVALLNQMGYKTALNPPGQLSNKEWNERTGYNNGPLPTDNNGRMDGNLNNPNEIHPGDKNAPPNIAPMPNAASFMAPNINPRLLRDLAAIDRQEQTLLHQAALTTPNRPTPQLFMIVHRELLELH